MGVKLKKDDWIFGFLSKDRENKLLFGMRLLTTLDFNEYFNDPKYQKKKPIISGSWNERCGDNFYYKDSEDVWQQAETIYHLGKFKQDTRYPRVFISESFYYFGVNSVTVPKKFYSIIPQRQGVKCNNEPEITNNFIEWLRKNHSFGRHGDPLDNNDNMQITSRLTTFASLTRTR